MRPLAAVLLVFTLTAAAALAAAHEPAAEIQPRVEYHLGEAARLTQHFEALVVADCPRLPSVAEWNVYVTREIDQMLLLAAHIEQAWVEAKRTSDKDVRRAAKAPGRRLDEAIQVVDKLSGCAQENGTTFSPGPVYRRLERDLPQRQAEIALPR
jgi:hypothetical protein